MGGTHDLSLFLITAFTLTLIPGPSTLYILGRSISQGRQAGVLSVLGISSGTLCHTFAVAFGLSALLAASQIAFSVIKYAGAAYLIFLGLQTLRRKHLHLDDQTVMTAKTPLGQIYGQGLLTQLLNPKVSLFFIALLPQFVRPTASHHPLPFLLLGAFFVTIDTLWFLLIASGSTFFVRRLRQTARVQKLLQGATGVLYIGLGLNLLRAKARFTS